MVHKCCFHCLASLFWRTSFARLQKPFGCKMQSVNLRWKLRSFFSPEWTYKALLWVSAPRDFLLKRVNVMLVYVGCHGYTETWMRSVWACCCAAEFCLPLISAWEEWRERWGGGWGWGLPMQGINLTLLHQHGDVSLHIRGQSPLNDVMQEKAFLYSNPWT